MRIETLTIIGVGLIGGSVGLAAKARGVAGRIVGSDSNPAALDEAVRSGAIDEAADIAPAVQWADLILVATPVDVIAGHVLEAATANPRAVIVDAGSTKESIVAAVGSSAPRFVPGHPMAGSEKKGPHFSRPDLFEGRAAILTPTDACESAAVQAAGEFWTALGCRVVTMTPVEHDRAVAMVSHLPHAVAACLAGMMPLDLLPVSAGGFRDTTRVAGAGPGIWEPIFRANRSAVLAAADRFADHWAQFRALLAADDGPGLARWLADAKQVRDALGS
ncbi:MAG TPA: prephenate dehydrogenase/arogenate dehydrogenase family protein [Fimbriiglobus sp.]|jgi:prephenate dehydrogenase